MGKSSNISDGSKPAADYADNPYYEELHDKLMEIVRPDANDYAMLRLLQRDAMSIKPSAASENAPEATSNTDKEAKLQERGE